VGRLTLPLAVIALALLSAAGGYLVQQWWQARSVPGVSGPVGEPRPDFALSDTQGRIHTAHEFDGKVVVLNFWATWCPPCRREIPGFLALQKRYGSRGLQFVGIAIDDVPKVKSFMDSVGMNYPVLVGEQKGIELSTRLGNRMGVLPFTAIIDRRARVRHVQMGEIRPAEAEKLILPLL
jgi:peroxiredoxin